MCCGTSRDQGEERVYRLLPWLTPPGYQPSPAVALSELPRGVDYATVHEAVRLAMPDLRSLPGSVDLTRNPALRPAVAAGVLARAVTDAGGGPAELMRLMTAEPRRGTGCGCGHD